MVTVMELLSHQLFANFTLVTDTSGLSNPVISTGILDWESTEDIQLTFNPGEFILTTLSSSTDDNTEVDTLLRALMKKQVSAIAIKNIHNHRLSSEIIESANLCHILIFVFQETYVDDLIYVIREAVNNSSFDGVMINKLRKIMSAENNEDIKELAQDLNPFFCENHICCFCVPKSEKSTRELIKQYSKAYRNSISVNDSLPNHPYLMVEGNGSIVFIFSAATDFDIPDETNEQSIRKDFSNFLNNIDITTQNFRIGISHSKNSLSQLRESLLESYFSALSCIIDEESLLQYDQIGIDKVLLPTVDSAWTRSYYDSFHDALMQYDEEHNSNLHDTLLMYIRNGGDIILTAEMLYQHQNTIRYRLGRIKEILHIDDTAEPYLQMHLYARLHKIYLLLDGEDLL